MYFKLSRIHCLLRMAGKSQNGKVQVKLEIETMLILPPLCQNICVPKRKICHKKTHKTKTTLILPRLVNESPKSKHFQLQNKTVPKLVTISVSKYFYLQTVYLNFS
jgi:hypothetical protein